MSFSLILRVGQLKEKGLSGLDIGNLAENEMFFLRKIKAALAALLHSLQLFA